MRRFYPGIHARLILPFLLVSIIIAGVGVFFVTRLVAGSVQERFTNQLLDSAQAATNSIVEVERQQLALLRVMAYTEGVAGALLDSDADRLDVWLRPLAANDEVDELIVFDLHGQSILRLGREPRETGEYGYREEVKATETLAPTLAPSLAVRLADLGLS